jgi:hypothetical protein
MSGEDRIRRSEVGKGLKAGIGPGRRMPAARESGETSLMFWVHPTLGADEMRATCRAVEKVMCRAQRNKKIGKGETYKN